MNALFSAISQNYVASQQPSGNEIQQLELSWSGPLETAECFVFEDSTIMIDGSEKFFKYLDLEPQTFHFIERCSECLVIDACLLKLMQIYINLCKCVFLCMSYLNSRCRLNNVLEKFKKNLMGDGGGGVTL